MVKVKLWGTLRQWTEGEAEVQVEGQTFKQVLDALALQYPGLAPQIRRGVSLAVNGTIYRDAWFQPIPPDAEVVLMPFMKGG
jgi:molybdopterin converting factor small subunit